jgi:hypothetical protein
MVAVEMAERVLCPLKSPGDSFRRYGVPPYHANKSKAQQRMKFVLAKQGKMSMADARGAARASKGKSLPVHVRKKRRAK